MDPITLAIDGKRYRLVAEIVPLGQKAEFTLRAIHKQTGRTSVVNQLNAILCTFFAGNFPEEWPWTVSWDKALSWAQTFVSIAQTSATATWNQLAYLEDRLDEDRAEGEWANLIDTIDALSQVALVKRDAALLSVLNYDEKERHARALDYRDTPLAEQLDDNPVPGIDY